jgi:hypothetical protein
MYLMANVEKDMDVLFANALSRFGLSWSKLEGL